MGYREEHEAMANQLIDDHRRQKAEAETDERKQRAYARSAPHMQAFHDFCNSIRDEPEPVRLEKIHAWWRERGIGADFYYKHFDTPMGAARGLRSTSLWCIEDEQ